MKAIASAGEVVAPTRPDIPRGLNQLGNTCYLNSLLQVKYFIQSPKFVAHSSMQYFYTIKDLREAVLPMSKLDLKALDNEKLTDEDLKKHRVGGRLVTRREIVRSRKCWSFVDSLSSFLMTLLVINQLADLFYNLEYSEHPAVTPTLELAKLALVTSRDEEEDEIDKGGTDSSNDTDATLVEDGPSRATIDTPDLSQSSEKSILGKRGRELDGKSHEMEVESPISQSPMERDGFVMISCKDKASVEPQKNPVLEASSSKMQTNGNEENGTSDSKSPPRKRPEPSDSTMMFGKFL